MGYTHGHKWNDEEVEQKIDEVMHFYGIERMPTRGECEQYFGDKYLERWELIDRYAELLMSMKA